MNTHSGGGSGQKRPAKTDYNASDTEADHKGGSGSRASKRTRESSAPRLPAVSKSDAAADFVKTLDAIMTMTKASAKALQEIEDSLAYLPQETRTKLVDAINKKLNREIERLSQE